MNDNDRPAIIGLTVDDNHIAYLLQAASKAAAVIPPRGLTFVWQDGQGKRHLQTDQEFRETGQDLLEAAHRGAAHWRRRKLRPSVQDKGQELPIYNAPDRARNTLTFKWEPGRIARAIENYVYIASQSPAWQNEPARRFIDQLKNELLKTLHGYDMEMENIPNMMGEQE